MWQWVHCYKSWIEYGEIRYTEIHIVPNNEHIVTISQWIICEWKQSKNKLCELLVMHAHFANVLCIHLINIISSRCKRICVQSCTHTYTRAHRYILLISLNSSASAEHSLYHFGLWFAAHFTFRHIILLLQPNPFNIILFRSIEHRRHIWSTVFIGNRWINDCFVRFIHFLVLDANALRLLSSQSYLLCVVFSLLVFFHLVHFIQLISNWILISTLRTSLKCCLLHCERLETERMLHMHSPI